RSRAKSPEAEQPQAEAPRTESRREPSGPAADPQPQAVDIEAFSRNIARMVEQGGRALAAYLKPREQGRAASEGPDLVTNAVRPLGHARQYWLVDPQRALHLRTSLGKSSLDLWASTARRMAGEETPPAATADPRDKRFSDPEWSSNQFYDFV